MNRKDGTTSIQGGKREEKKEVKGDLAWSFTLLTPPHTTHTCALKLTKLRREKVLFIPLDFMQHRVNGLCVYVKRRHLLLKMVCTDI